MLTSGVSQNIHQAQLLRRKQPTLPMLTGFPAVCTPSLATRSFLVRNFTSHLRPHGAEPRRVLPLHCAQECGASLVVEGDDDAGGWQIRGIGQGWATGKRAGSQRQGGVGRARLGSSGLFCIHLAVPWDNSIRWRRRQPASHDMMLHPTWTQHLHVAWSGGPGRKQQIEGASQVGGGSSPKI